MLKPLRYWLPGFALVWLGAAVHAQPAVSAAGHWEGTIQTPAQPIDLSADLARNAAGVWIGSLSIPMANAIGLPLSEITVEGNAVRFVISDFPGKPAFEGKLSADASDMTGTATNPNGVTAFKLQRKGEAKVNLPAPSSAMSADFEGTWNGTIDAGGATLHLVLKLARAANGSAMGSMISVDQGGQEIPLSTVTIQQKQLQFEIRAAGAKFSGTLGANGELAGTFSQGPANLPLTFKRAPAAAK
jgi:hypothetical protein